MTLPTRPSGRGGGRRHQGVQRHLHGQLFGEVSDKVPGLVLQRRSEAAPRSLALLVHRAGLGPVRQFLDFCGLDLASPPPRVEVHLFPPLLGHFLHNLHTVRTGEIHGAGPFDSWILESFGLKILNIQ